MPMETVAKLREQDVVRYMQPLREGGSLPALVEADDTYKYVLKFNTSIFLYLLLILAFFIA